VVGDPVLWGQYSFPKKGMVEYKIPDPLQGNESLDNTLIFSDKSDVVMSDNSYVEVT